MEEYDEARRAALIRTLREQGLPHEEGASGGGPCPVVTLEEFFTGNNDYGSIGCNLSERENPEGPQGFYRVLKGIRARPEVQDVLVEVCEAEEEWPFSERVFVLAASTPAQVKEWMAPLYPDEVEEGYPFGVPPAAPPLKPGHCVYSAWWD